MPLVTVLMPCYNGEKYLREAIDSILNQTLSDFEFLIINDGSTDSSEEIIKSYSDPRINYVKNEMNMRLIATLNKGIKLAKGKYLARMDADDISMPSRLQEQVAFMESHPEVVLCGTGFENFSEGQPPVVVRYSPDHNTICLKHFFQIHLSHGTCIFRTRQIIDNNLFFNPDFSHAEDYELWSRMVDAGKLANIQNVLYRVRRHEGEVSVQYAGVQRANSLRVRHINFQKIGVEMSEPELLLYQRIAQFEYEPDAAFVSSAQALLEKIARGAKSTSYLSQKTIQDNAGWFWFNVTYNLAGSGVTSLKTYSSSILSRHYPLSLQQRMKFIFKSILRK